MKRNFLWLLLISLICTIVVAKPTQTSKTRFVRTSLANYKLGSKNFIKFDVQENYYLISEWDGLGRPTQVRLLLCPVPKQFGYDLANSDNDDTSYSRRLRREKLPRLCNGTGVNIGDSPAQVRRKIGAPHEKYYSETKTRLYVYRANNVIPLTVEGKRVKWAYKADYIFHSERLWAIDYFAIDPNVD